MPGHGDLLREGRPVLTQQRVHLIGLHGKLQVAEQGPPGLLQRVHIMAGGVQRAQQHAEKRRLGQLLRRQIVQRKIYVQVGDPPGGQRVAQHWQTICGRFLQGQLLRLRRDLLQTEHRDGGQRLRGIRRVLPGLDLGLTLAKIFQFLPVPAVPGGLKPGGFLRLLFLPCGVGGPHQHLTSMRILQQCLFHHLALDAVVPGEAHPAGEEGNQENDGEHDGFQGQQPPVVLAQDNDDAHQFVEGGGDKGDGPAEEFSDERAVGGGTCDEPVGHVLVEEGHGQAQILFEHQLLEVHLCLAGGDAAENLPDGRLQRAEEHAAHHEEDGPHAHVAGRYLCGGVRDDEAQLRPEEADQGCQAHPDPGYLDAGHQHGKGFPDAGLFFCSCWFYIVRHEKTSQSCYFAQIGPHKQRLGCTQSHSKAAAAPVNAPCASRRFGCRCCGYSVIFCNPPPRRKFIKRKLPKTLAFHISMWYDTSAFRTVPDAGPVPSMAVSAAEEGAGG